MLADVFKSTKPLSGAACYEDDPCWCLFRTDKGRFQLFKSQTPDAHRKFPCHFLPGFHRRAWMRADVRQAHADESCPTSCAGSCSQLCLIWAIVWHSLSGFDRARGKLGESFVLQIVL